MRHMAVLLSAIALGTAMQAAGPALAEPATVNIPDLINADRPGIAESSYVVGAGRFQIETGLQQGFYRGEGTNGRSVSIPTLLRLGLSEQVEIRLESEGYVWSRGHDAEQGSFREQGAAPVSIGLKYQFIDSEGPQRPSVGAIFRVFPPSGSGAFRTSRVTGDVRLVADWDFAPGWSLNPDIGFAIYEDEATRRPFTAGLFAMTLGYNPVDVLNLFVDAGLQTPEVRGGKTALILDAGVAYIIGRDIQLDASVGAAVAGGAAPRLFWSAGISKRF